MRKMGFFIFFLIVFLSPPKAYTFQFNSISDGEAVFAGSTLKVKIDPGDIAPLFGVLFTASGGVLKPRLDSLPPFDWSIEIPAHYYGPLTLWALGRRYYPAPGTPETSVTIFVIHPVLRASYPD